MKQYDYTLSETYFKNYYLNNYQSNQLINKWKHNLEKFNINEKYWEKLSYYLEDNFNNINDLKMIYGDNIELILNVTLSIFKHIDLSCVNFINNKNIEKVQFSFNVPHNSSLLGNNINTEQILFETIVSEFIKHVNKLIDETSGLNLYKLIDNFYIDQNNITFYGKRYYILGYFEGINTRLSKIKKIKKRLDERI